MHPKLSKSPLTYVLAQIKFSNIEKIEDRIPELQEKIRNFFPHYQKKDIPAYQLREGQQPSIAIFTQWHFLDKEKHIGIILDKETLTIHTSRYEQFQLLLDNFGEVVIKFHEVLNFSLAIRLGLRYVNLIEDGVIAVDERLQGFQLSGDGFDTRQFFARTETTQHTQEGFIKVQAMRIADKKIVADGQNIFVSSDLESVSKLLSFNHHKEPKKEFLLLDIDHFNNNQSNFDVKEISKRFHKLHKPIYSAFCKAVGQENLNNWK